MFYFILFIYSFFASILFSVKNLHTVFTLFYSAYFPFFCSFLSNFRNNIIFEEDKSTLKSFWRMSWILTKLEKKAVKEKKLLSMSTKIDARSKNHSDTSQNFYCDLFFFFFFFFKISRKSHEVVSKKSKDQCFVVGGRLTSSKEKNKSESLRTCFLWQEAAPGCGLGGCRVSQLGQGDWGIFTRETNEPIANFTNT